jgi:hypothetical protein
MLLVRNGAKAVEFYKQAFSARELFLIKNDTGDVVARKLARCSLPAPSHPPTINHKILAGNPGTVVRSQKKDQPSHILRQEIAL